MKKFKVCKNAIIIYFVLFSILSCNEKVKKEDLSSKQAFDLIQAHQNDSSFIIIDFRPVEKYNAAHIENAIYFDVFSDSVDNWLNTLYKDNTYLIYCTIGHRSGIAFEKMKKMNFKKVYHLFQGLTVWKDEGYKISIELINEIKKIKGVHGIHITALFWEDIVPSLVKETGLYPRSSF